MTRIIGASHSEGTFESNGKEIAYNNILLHLTTDDDENTCGLTASTLKIKYENFKAITGLDPMMFGQLVDSEVNLIYGIVKDKAVLKRIEKTEKGSGTSGK